MASDCTLPPCRSSSMERHAVWLHRYTTACVYWVPAVGPSTLSMLAVCTMPLYRPVALIPLHPERRLIPISSLHSQNGTGFLSSGCVQMQVMGAMLTVAIFLGWLCVMGMTLVRAWQGHLFRAYSPSQPMVKVLPESSVRNGTNGV